MWFESRIGVGDRRYSRPVWWGKCSKCSTRETAAMRAESARFGQVVAGHGVNDVGAVARDGARNVACYIYGAPVI